MPLPTVENHPDREKIIEALINGKSQRTVAKQFDINPSSVQRYLSERLAGPVQAAALDRDKQDGQAVLNQINEIMSYIRKMLVACDEYLSDPDDPSKYELGPRAWDIDVVYQEDIGERTVTKKAGLDTILKRIGESGYDAVEIKFKQADPRKLILETAAVLTKQLELIAKIEGAIQDTTINVTFNEYWTRLKQIVWKATEGAPQVRAKIVKEIEDVSNDQSSSN